MSGYHLKESLVLYIFDECQNMDRNTCMAFTWPLFSTARVKFPSFTSPKLSDLLAYDFILHLLQITSLQPYTFSIDHV